MITKEQIKDKLTSIGVFDFQEEKDWRGKTYNLYITPINWNLAKYNFKDYEMYNCFAHIRLTENKMLYHLPELQLDTSDGKVRIEVNNTVMVYDEDTLETYVNHVIEIYNKYKLAIKTLVINKRKEDMLKDFTYCTNQTKRSPLKGLHSLIKFSLISLILILIGCTTPATEEPEFCFADHNCSWYDINGKLVTEWLCKEEIQPNMTCK
mgnify:CR=1 FL=1